MQEENEEKEKKELEEEKEDKERRRRRMIKKKEHSRVLTSSSSINICVEHLSSIVLIMDNISSRAAGSSTCAGLMRPGVFGGGVSNLYIKQNDTHTVIIHTQYTCNNTASIKQ